MVVDTVVDRVAVGRVAVAEGRVVVAVEGRVVEDIVVGVVVVDTAVEVAGDKAAEGTAGDTVGEFPVVDTAVVASTCPVVVTVVAVVGYKGLQMRVSTGSRGSSVVRDTHGAD